MRLFIIGLGNQRPSSEFTKLLEQSMIVAREGDAARRWLSSSEHKVADLSPQFDVESVASIPDDLLETLSSVGMTTGSVCYLVPGAANVGDMSVHYVMSEFECTVVPGTLDVPAGLGSCSIVDALSLAIAEEARPFDSGMEDIDTGRALVVTNLRGRRIESLAWARLQRVYDRPADIVQGDVAVYRADREFGATTSMAQLERIVAALRSPSGCPWDREQSIESLLPQLREELDEFEESWALGDAQAQADELGDVLLHIVMMAQIAHEDRRFDFNAVVRAVTGKMVRRHPHVFGDAEIDSVDELHAMWENIKAQERAHD